MSVFLAICKLRFSSSPFSAPNMMMIEDL